MIAPRHPARGRVRWSIDVRAALIAEARGETEMLGLRLPAAVLAEEEQLVAPPASGEPEPTAYR